MKGEWAPAHGHGETSRRTELKMHNVLNVFLLFAMQNASTTPRNAPATTQLSSNCLQFVGYRLTKKICRLMFNTWRTKYFQFDPLLKSILLATDDVINE